MTPSVVLLSPHAPSWGDFHCGEPQLDAKLAREVRLGAYGLQRLYGIQDARRHIVAAMTLRAGVLQAPQEVLGAFGTSEVPTLHIEVLAVRVGHQARGLGRAPAEHALLLGADLHELIGLRTVSLEATRESVGFYRHLGFDRSERPWPDGSWPVWFDLLRQEPAYTDSVCFRPTLQSTRCGSNTRNPYFFLLASASWAERHLPGLPARRSS